ncbi:ABC-2 type transport system ATP-binding protein [Clostridium collagenovorans DSM 3089]|uniref:ABC-2 type transport system ATP-binding protein n=1 Tax=Clostridium collagenovorans DSM 3089 TaxID=1121306 RepID=A0A1M5U7H2_9CLOT|nr:ABC transporter ATP-binding protein [Clostridium collagenovorans]SHH58914.1 ABC-2 type transport system ATP-binding protein [Clostridium collagenovorans DSM 3089]
MDNILEIKHLSKDYGSKVALNDVNISISKGKIVGLLGPNGSGKSTMIKLINGLLQPSDGEILINGMHPSIETKAVVAYLPERTYLSEWMKVEELINFFDDFYVDFDRAKALDMVKALKIDMKSKIKSMSKGTKEKVQLILVMSRKASIYILDEPIGGVDPAAREYILNTIIKNYSEDSSIVLATHFIQEIESLCDDIIFLNNGQVVLEGNVDDIKAEKGKSIDALFREVFRC